VLSDYGFYGGLPGIVSDFPSFAVNPRSLADPGGTVDPLRYPRPGGLPIPYPSQQDASAVGESLTTTYVSEQLRTTLRAIRAAKQRWARHRVTVPTSLRQSSAPSIFVLVPDFDRPAGGIQVMYRHVDILNRSGTRAFVLHQRPGFRCSWFDHQTQVTNVKESAVGPRDLLVVGELDVDVIATRNLRVPHVVLNQSGYLTWNGGPSVARHYSSSSAPRAIITVSEHAAALLRYAYPMIDVRRVRPGLDTGRFAPDPEPPQSRVSYMPRRGDADARILLELLTTRGVLDGWEIRRLEGLTHETVATELRRSSVFITLSAREGFGLPAAEAMACGNYVIGYDGLGGREFFRPEFSRSVEAGNVLAVAEALEEVVTQETAHPGWLRTRGLAASTFVRSEYCEGNEERDVIAAYSGLLADA
jgi:glycosyltransferase involved in cell wall biosynthesis